MKILSVSKDANSNYLCKIVKLDKIRPHPNAGRLFLVTIDFQDIVIGGEMKEGDVVVYYPLESVVNKKFLAFCNSYRDKDLNSDKEQVGFFESKGRVRAVKLRGQKSMGYIVAASKMEEFLGVKISDKIGEEFDNINGVTMIEKYIIPSSLGGMGSAKLGKKPRISRLVDGQVHLHVDTEQLRKNADRINPDDIISVTYKLHGTSFWVANVWCKRKLKFIERIVKAVGLKIDLFEYDYFYGSRKVVKNEYETQGTNDFYDGSLWASLKDEIKEFVPKNYTFYGECVGHTLGGQAIQAKYDYGCKQQEHKAYIYRITFTNPDGIVRDLSTDEIREWAAKAGFNYVPHFYTGKAKDLFPELSVSEHWNEEFVRAMEKKYLEKDCFMCRNVVPEEGVVLRKESAFQFETFKLKSWRYFEHETEMLDAGQEDMESQV